MKRRYWLPLLLMLAGVIGLSGCVFVPWPEHQIVSAQSDFRPLVAGDSSTDWSKPIHAGHVNRARIVQLLGLPPLESEDRRACAYVLDTRSGYWVYPLCFAAVPANTKAYVLYLHFTQDGRLDHAEIKDRSTFEDPIFAYEHDGVDELLVPFNQRGPQLEEKRPELFLVPPHLHRSLNDPAGLYRSQPSNFDRPNPGEYGPG